MKPIKWVFTLLLTPLMSYSSFGQLYWSEKSGIDLSGAASNLPDVDNSGLGFYFNGSIFYGMGQKQWNLRPPTFLNQFYNFHLNDSAWFSSSGAPFQGRAGSSTFLLLGKFYLIGGKNFVSNSSFYDCWEFDPYTHTWTQKSDFPGRICCNDCIPDACQSNLK